MPREAEPSLNERQFVTQALKEGLRLDGRELDQYRKLELTFGEQYGVVEVSLGKTKCVFSTICSLFFPIQAAKSRAVQNSSQNLR